MENLYEKLDILKRQLDDTTCVKELKRLYKEIIKDKDLIELIKKYNCTKDERIKENILANPIIREYKHQEAQLNFLILEINQELKQITKDKCGLWK